MSVYVFSGDPVLSRMLLLEAKRCGLTEATPTEAAVWLIDLDHPVPRPKGDGAPLQIALSSRVEEERQGFSALLELPFRARDLDTLLLHHRAPVPALMRDGEGLRLGGKKLRFSRTEQALLDLLVQNRDRVVTQQELSSVLGESAENSNATAVYLYRLRRKLEADGITRIRTVRGVGYQWMGD